MIFCSSFGMFLSANLPLTMELESTGSVGVTQAPTARACRKLRCGTNTYTRRLVQIHIIVIPGPNKRAKLFHSFFKYLLGSWTPARTNWTPRTSLVKYKVMVSSVSVFPRAYSSGLMRFVACGENIRPAIRDITIVR